MSIDPELTLFQADCERAVSAELRLHGLEMVGRTIRGAVEAHVRARLGASDIEVFIYDDEARIRGPRTDLRFPAPDFLSSADLIGEVVASIRWLAQNGHLTQR